MAKFILITGGAGFIGSHTAYYFSQKGYQAIILDTLVYNQSFDYKWATLLQYDFADRSILQDVFEQYKPEVVIHCAAQTTAEQSIENPSPCYDTNVNKTLILLDAMLKCKINNFIFSSSSAVYGDVQLGSIPEEHSKEPVNPYGKTKLIIEMALADLHKAHNLNYICLRHFNVAGTLVEHNLTQHNPEAHIIPLLVSAAFEQKPFFIFGNDYQTIDGTYVRDFVHVWDVAHAHWCAFEYLQKENAPDVFNIGSGTGISIRSLIDLTSTIAQKEILLQTAQKRAGDPALLIADIAKTVNILQWKPQYSDIQFIIQSAIQSFKKQYEHTKP